MVTKHRPVKKRSASSKSKAKCVPESQMKVINDLRKLWIDHALWTHNAIVSIVAGSEDTEPIVQRLLRNQDDIGDFFKTYYGTAVGNQLASLLREHINIAGQLVVAAKAGDKEEVERLNRLWYSNGDQIVDFLSQANPHLDHAELKAMFRKHLQQVAEIVAARLTGDWAKEIRTYDQGEKHLIHLETYLAEGLIKQFPAKFK